MNNIMSNISLGFSAFPLMAILLTLPFMLLPLIKDHKINFVKVGINYLFLMYMLCVIALVFFPLPDMAMNAKLSTHDIQICPFRFVVDIIKESPLVITNPATYLPALKNRAIWQVIFNVFMTVPFGMYLAYYFECSRKQVITFSFLLSLFIEVGQLTGLFFIFNGSYRLCDVDDLIMNTLGGLIGYVIVAVVGKRVPRIAHFDLYLNRKMKVQY